MGFVYVRLVVRLALKLVGIAEKPNYRVNLAGKKPCRLAMRPFAAGYARC